MLKKRTFFRQANLSVVNIQPSRAPATTPKLYILRRWQLVSKFVTSCMLPVTTIEGPEVVRGVTTRMCIQERWKDVVWLSDDAFSSLSPIGDEVHSCLIVPSNGCSLPRRAHQPPSMVLYYHWSIRTSMRTKNTSTITHQWTTGCKVESTFRPLGWILRISEMWLNEVGMLGYSSHCRAWPVGFANGAQDEALDLCNCIIWNSMMILYNMNDLKDRRWWKWLIIWQELTYRSIGTPTAHHPVLPM